MKLIIKTLDDRKTKLAKIMRDLLDQSENESIILVPHGVQEIFIFEEGESGWYSVSLWSNCDELDLTEGLACFENAKMYATAVAKEAGLTESNIKLITEKMYVWML